MGASALLGALCLLGLLAGCGGEPGAGSGEKITIDVLCAASTAHVVEPLARDYARDHPGVVVRCNAGSSSTLARQIEQGAPADLFISANVKWMDHLAERGLIRDESRRDLLGNRLVLVANKKGPDPFLADEKGADPFLIADAAVAQVLAATAGRVAMGDPDHVPAGVYGRQALANLGLWPTIEPRVIPTKDVRSALLLVERGETELGVVYATDAASSGAVAVVATFPRESHEPIVYPAALVKGASAEAGGFYDYLRGDAARAAFEGAGFAFVVGGGEVR